MYGDSEDIYLLPDKEQLYWGNYNGHIIKTDHIQSICNRPGPNLNLFEVTHLRTMMVKYAKENGIAIKDSWDDELAAKKSLANKPVKPKGLFSKIFGTS